MGTRRLIETEETNLKINISQTWSYQTMNKYGDKERYEFEIYYDPEYARRVAFRDKTKTGMIARYNRYVKLKNRRTPDGSMKWEEVFTWDRSPRMNNLAAERIVFSKTIKMPTDVYRALQAWAKEQKYMVSLDSGGLAPKTFEGHYIKKKRQGLL